MFSSGQFSSAFREFETDPFFNFGNSPFNSRQRPHFREAADNRLQPQLLQPASSRRIAALPDPAEVESRRLAAADDQAVVPAADRHRSDRTAALEPSSSSRPAAPDDEAATRRMRRLQDPDEDAHERRLDRYDDRRRRRDDPQAGGYADDALAPFPSMFGGFGAIESHFNQMFDGMHRMMADMGSRMRQMEAAAARDDFDGHMYSHASVYSRGGGGGAGGEPPHVYQAMSETRAGPGGVRETRRAMRDSRSRDERMALGRHLGARGHVVERRRNTGTGDQQEDHSFTGVDEAEGDAFDGEWHSRATALFDSSSREGTGGGGRALRGRRDGPVPPSQRPLAIAEGGGSQHPRL